MKQVSNIYSIPIINLNHTESLNRYLIEALQPYLQGFSEFYTQIHPNITSGMDICLYNTQIHPNITSRSHRSI